MEYIIAAVLIGIAIGLAFAFFIGKIIKRNDPYRQEIERIKAHRQKIEKAKHA